MLSEAAVGPRRVVGADLRRHVHRIDLEDYVAYIESVMRVVDREDGPAVVAEPEPRYRAIADPEVEDQPVIEAHDEVEDESHGVTVRDDGDRLSALGRIPRWIEHEFFFQPVGKSAFDEPGGLTVAGLEPSSTSG